MKPRYNLWAVSLVLTVILVLNISLVRAAIPASERQALIYFYYSLGGNDWNINTGWLGDVGTECSWRGVTCTGDRVTRLYIPSNNLIGPIPISLEDLPLLTVLDLHNNGLSGPILLELADLSGLLELDLSHNELTGPIPAELGSLLNLLKLDLGDNLLTGSIPPELGSLSTLQGLYLSSNQLTGPIPPELGDLTSLLTLYLPNNQLSGSIPSELGSLSSLQGGLYLSDNQLTGQIPPELGNLTSAWNIQLDFNQLSGPIPPELGGLSGIYYLVLSSNGLTGSIPSELGSLSTVRRIDLSSNRLSGPIPPELSNLPNLVLLDLSFNRLTGSIPQEFSTLPSIENIDVRSNNLVGDLPIALINLTILEDHGSYLDFNGLFTNDPALAAFLEQKFGSTWADTQTVPPENVSAINVSDHAVWLVWDPVTYIDPGGYEVFFAPVGTNNWKSGGWTVEKSVTEFPVTGLSSGSSFDFAVASFTQPHIQNENYILSWASDSLVATTANIGCLEPMILIDWGCGITLSVDGTNDTFLWSTGETTATITVTPTSPQWYWVTVTFGASCEETVAVFVDPAIVFADGFELGDTSAWTQVAR